MYQVQEWMSGQLCTWRSGDGEVSERQIDVGRSSCPKTRGSVAAATWLLALPWIKHGET